MVLESGAPMSEIEKHDQFNLVATSTLTAMTCVAYNSEPWNWPLALIMCLYLVVDSIWLVLRPEIAGGQEGGGANTLLSHHGFALLVAMHALTWAPHTHYTCWMTVVEVNTLILMLERRLPVGAPSAPLVHKTFVGSWVVTRLLWFPFLAAKLSMMDSYPSAAVHLTCAGSLLALTALQLVWTWNFCVPPERQIPLS